MSITEFQDEEGCMWGFTASGKRRTTIDAIIWVDD
jgi:hypothetical protein